MDTGFPLTDIHIHFCSSGRYHDFKKFCESSGIRRAGLVSLPDLKEGNFNIAVLAAASKDPDRFIAFGCLDYRKTRTESEGAGQVRQLVMKGFTGLKLWVGKPQVQEEFGVRLEDDIITGALKAAGDLRLPVILHLADPPPFWEEGGVCSGISGTAVKYDTFDSWIDRGRMLFSRFPEVSFIGAHLLFLGGNLEMINEVMKSHPNLLLDSAPGRWFFRPLGLRKKEAEVFFNKYSGRILLGSDSMFFPAGYTVFPDPGLDGNLKAFNRIKAFLTGSAKGYSGRVDDPFPHEDYECNDIDCNKNENGSGMLPCLELKEETVDRIMGKNAGMLFEGRVL